MSKKKASNIYGYTHIKQTKKKRPGKHSKKLNKKNRKRKKYRGQGR
jgi:hypothetical protein